MASRSTLLKLALGAGLTSLVAACGPSTPAAPPTVIRYEVGMGVPWCEHCYASVITASSTGAVEVERRTNDRPATQWVIAKETVQVTPEQFAAFQTRLAALRPTGERKTEDTEDCAVQLKEQDRVTVTWTEGERKDTLDHSFDCAAPKGLEITQALLAAPGDLGIKVEVTPPPPLK